MRRAQDALIDRANLVSQLEDAGFVAAHEDAADLLAAAVGDPKRLDALVKRRLSGEPIAWIVGHTTFCDIDIRIDTGVYVPRWQTEPLVRRAIGRLPAHGVAVDLCTGSGAVACVLAKARPHARVVATDIDNASVLCAKASGVEAYTGDLFSPLPRALVGQVDVIIGSVPYVPTAALPLLQRDTFTFESTRAYDGGPDGLNTLRRVVAESPMFLRPGGYLLLELGGNQADLLAPDLAASGFDGPTVLRDDAIAGS